MFAVYQHLRSLVFGEEEKERDNSSEVPLPKPPIKSEKQKRYFTGVVTSANNTSGMIDQRVFFEVDNVIGGQKPAVGATVHVCATREHSQAGWRATRVEVTSQWQPEGRSEQEVLIGYVAQLSPTRGLIDCNTEEITFSPESGMCANGYKPFVNDWVSVSLLYQDGERMVNEVRPLREKAITGNVSSVLQGYGTIEEDVYFHFFACARGYRPRVGDSVRVVCVEYRHQKSNWRALSVEPASALPEDKRFFIRHHTPSLPLLPSSTLTPTQSALSQNGVGVGDSGDAGEVDGVRSEGVITTDPSVSLISPSTSYTGHQRRWRGRGSYHAKMAACRVPGERPLRPHPLRLPCRLKPYPIPNDLRECFSEEEEVERLVVSVRPQLREPLCMENYCERFSSLLFVEELKREEDMRQFDMCSASMRHCGQYLSLAVPGLAEGRPSLLVGDRVIVCEPALFTYNPAICCWTTLPHLPWEVRGEDVLLRFSESFHEKFDNEDYDVMFTFNRTQLRRMHHAVEIAKFIGPKTLFPGTPVPKPPLLRLKSPDPILYQPVSDPHQPVSDPHQPVSVTGQTGTIDQSVSAPNQQSVSVPDQSASVPDQSVSVPDQSASVPDQSVSVPDQSVPVPDQQFFNPVLNSRQKSAISRILGAQCRPAPYVLFGPPGTGKTVTLVEAILQIHTLSKGSRILACAPSNSAADLLAERLHLSGRVKPREMVRLNAIQRLQSAPPCIEPYCTNTDSVDTASLSYIVISTCVTAGTLHGLGLSIGHFTHVFVDEAGQATEPECLVPISLLAGTHGQVVLAGDPHQLGPVLSSRLASTHGLGLSLLERLMRRPAYQRDETKFADHGNYDPLMVTKLVDNYRSHEALLKLYSDMFYHGELCVRADPRVTHPLTSWEGLPQRGFPLVFHGVQGEDMREGNSPSWFNPVEAVQVVRYVQSLKDNYTYAPKLEDIAVITPYRKQVEKIRQLLCSVGVEAVRVGSVEEFQGQERQAIIISTVRSTCDLLDFDLRHHLGFLSNPKRFNVAISRAQALLIVIGDPFLLVQDPHWYKLVQYAIGNGAYTGCLLPPHNPHTTPPSPRDPHTTLPPPHNPPTTPPSPRDPHTTLPPPHNPHTISPPPQDPHTTPPSPQDPHTTLPPPHNPHTIPPLPQDSHTAPPP